LRGAKISATGGKSAGLYEIEFTPFDAMKIGKSYKPTTGGTPLSGGIESIEFVEGTLFGGTNDRGDKNDGGQLVTIDPATTEYTIVGQTTSSDGSLGSLAFTDSFVDLSITMIAVDDTVNVGEAVTFIVTLDNIGPDDATNIDVLISIPSEIIITNVDPSTGDFNTGIWTIPNLAVVDSPATLTITGTPDVSGVIENTAEVVSMDSKHEDVDSTPGNNDSSEDDQDSVTVTVNALPVVTISIPSAPVTINEGDSQTFTATATDVEDDDSVVTDSIVWTSDLVQGIIGGGGTINPVLSVGVHTITATATDSLSATGSAVAPLVTVVSTGPIPGPKIVSVIGGDTNVPTVTGFSAGDTITIRFSEETNRPVVSTIVDIDKLFTFTPSIGVNYVGTWTSTTTLVITILDTGNLPIPTPLTIKVEPAGNLRNAAGNSLVSDSQFDATFTVEDFGKKEAPFIVSITAADPNVQVVTGFSDGDTITVRFSEETNEPFKGTDDQVTQTDLDKIFKYLQGGGELTSLAGSYSGKWLNALTLRITIDNADIATKPAIAQLRLEVKETAELQDQDKSSIFSTSLSPPLTGTFGIEAGPSITSLVADDPDGGDAQYGAGDTITVRFSEDTNEPDPTPAVAGLEKDDLDILFDFSQSLGDGYTGVFVDPATLVITIQDAGNAVITKDSIGVFTVTLLASGDLKDADNTSLASTDTSPLLTGNFGTRLGPSIESVKGADPDGIVGVEAGGFTDGDTITITFNENTNRPRVSTIVDLDKLFLFTPSIGVNYVGTWVSPSVLVITILDTDGIATPTPLTIKVEKEGNLRNEAGTSSISVLEFIATFTNEDFGQTPGPSIISIKAADPEPVLDAVFGNGDTITVRFSEATNEPFKVETGNDLVKANLDDLFIFSQSIGDDYIGKWLNALTLLITIEENLVDI